MVTLAAAGVGSVAGVSITTLACSTTGAAS